MMHSCTSNPFWDDSKTREIKIYGHISLDDQDKDVPVFIWADIFNSYTKTDKDGLFSLPLDNSQTQMGNINGPVQVYFYVHNYILDSATVFFTDGEFSSDQTEFSNDGMLIKNISLRKLISASSYFLFDQQNQSPDINLNDVDSLKFILTLDIHHDTDISINNKVVSHHDYLPSGILFNNILDGFLYTYRLPNDQLLTYGFSKGESIDFYFDIVCDSLQIDSGDYEVIPFLLVNQNTIPLGLIEALGGLSLFDIGISYLQLPNDFTYDTLKISN